MILFGDRVYEAVRTGAWTLVAALRSGSRRRTANGSPRDRWPSEQTVAGLRVSAGDDFARPGWEVAETNRRRLL